MYAALDAYCLIEIYETIRGQFTSLKNPFMGFDDFMHDFLTENKNKININKRNIQNTGNGNNIPTKPQQVRPPSISKQQK